MRRLLLEARQSDKLVAYSIKKASEVYSDQQN